MIDAWRRAGSRGLRWLDAPQGEHEAGYREHFLRSDISQALFGLGLLTIPVVFFAWTDFLLYGWSVPFGLLILLRSGTSLARSRSRSGGAPSAMLGPTIGCSSPGRWLAPA